MQPLAPHKVHTQHDITEKYFALVSNKGHHQMPIMFTSIYKWKCLAIRNKEMKYFDLFETPSKKLKKLDVDI